MALKATLKIEGTSFFYDVRDLDYKLVQPTGDKNEPTGLTQGGQINFTILANNQDNCLFQEWVTELATVKNGYFVLPIIKGIEHETIDLKFELAYCTSLQVFYGSYNNNQMYMKVTIVATRMIFGNSLTFYNDPLTTLKEKQSNPKDEPKDDTTPK